MCSRLTINILATEDVAASTQSQAFNPAFNPARSNGLPPNLAIRDPSDKLTEGPINFGRRSGQNSTLQNSLAVKSADHSWPGDANAEKLKS
jgi:hypothetical protein